MAEIIAKSSFGVRRAPKDGQPSYTYVRYSDDEGKTFTAAKPWDEPLTKEICPDVSSFVAYSVIEDAKVGTNFNDTLTTWANRITCNTPIPCTWDIAYNVAEGYSIFVDRKSTRLNSSHANISYA